MKKQVAILSFLLCICLFSWSQEIIKLTTPCNDELVKKTPGRWIPRNGLHAKISKQQQQEILNRLDKIQQLVFTIYPSPLGLDALWSRKTFDEDFASQLKISRLPGDKIYTEEINGIPWVYYEYNTLFANYQCGREPNEILRAPPDKDEGTVVTVPINRLEGCFLRSISNKPLMEAMRIDGRPIKLMPVRQGKWKGYDVYVPEQGSSEKIVLLHRQGMLPYIPVTRKEYLDRCIEFLSKYLTPNPEDLKNIELMTGKKERDEQEKKLKKLKDDVLKHYQDELEATTSAGLLDSDAIVRVPIADLGTTTPIFIPETSGGTMLVTENPAYLRKDIPKYIPQFMIFSWLPYHLAMEPYKAIDENFPIEKLQAMIDK